jgi:hypothetical protein
MDNADPRLLAMLRQQNVEQPQGNSNAAPDYLTGDATQGNTQQFYPQPLAPLEKYVPPKSPFDILNGMGTQSAMGQSMMDNNAIAQGGKAADSSQGYGAMGRGLNSAGGAIGGALKGGLESVYGGMGQAFTGLVAF